MSNGSSSSAGQFEVQVTFTVEGLEQELNVLEFHGSERLSTLFSYNIDLACREADLDFTQIVGQPALLSITRQDDTRYVHGLVSHFQQQRRGRTFTLYDAILEPRAFRMENRIDCRIYQNMTMKDVVTRVLQQHQVTHRFRCRGNQDPPEREYCVQYRETDWNFVSRLLAEEGYFFFFQHTDSSHEMVISNDRTVHEEIPGEGTVPFGAPDSGSASRERIHQMSYAEQVVPGKVALQDYNFQMPQVDFSSEHESGEGEAELEVYDYPGVYAAPEQGQNLSQVRQEANEALRRGGHASSDCVRLIPGYTFTLSGHHQTSLNDQEYLVTRITSDGATVTDLDEGRVSAVCDYSNSFTYIPAEVPFRPQQAPVQTRVMGSQTAVVVGPAGQEIHTNEQGQVKVQFHWDRLGQNDQQSSCWVRVAQPWAGDGYGFVWTPRIGNEVVVEFLEGDPDRPLITGSVYHVQNPPPLDLPAQQTRSTIKSRSTPGGGGFNEIRFEDQKNAEEIYTHAQRNQTEVVRNDHSTTVGHDQSRTVKNDRTATIQSGNDEVTVETGSRTTKVKAGAGLTVQTKNRAVKVETGDYTLDTDLGKITQTAKLNVSVLGKTKGVQIVGKGKGVSVTGNSGDTTGVDVQGRGTVGVNIFGHPKVKAKGGESVWVSAPKIELTAGEKVLVHVNDDKVEITGGNITISSGTVRITGSTTVEVDGGGSTANLKSSGVQISGTLIKLNT